MTLSIGAFIFELYRGRFFLRIPCIIELWFARNWEPRFAVWVDGGSLLMQLAGW